MLLSLPPTVSPTGCVDTNHQIKTNANQTAPGSIQGSLFKKGHGHGPNTNMANGLGNPTDSLIEAGSLNIHWAEREESEIRNSKGEMERDSGEAGDKV